MHHDYFTTDRASYSAEGTLSLAGGLSNVGMCIQNAGAALVSNNSAVNGWVMGTP